MKKRVLVLTVQLLDLQAASEAGKKVFSERLDIIVVFTWQFCGYGAKPGMALSFFKACGLHHLARLALLQQDHGYRAREPRPEQLESSVAEPFGLHSAR